MLEQLQYYSDETFALAMVILCYRFWADNSRRECTCALPSGLWFSCCGNLAHGNEAVIWCASLSSVTLKEI